MWYSEISVPPLLGEINVKNFIKNNPFGFILVNLFIIVVVAFIVTISRLPDKDMVRRGTVTIFDKQGATQMQYEGNVKITEDRNGNVDVHVYLDFNEEDYK